MSLDNNSIVIVAGAIWKVRDGMLTVTQCDGLAIKWSDLTSEQKAGVKGGYSRQCESCRISSAGTTKHIWSPEAEAGLESGYWSPEGCFFNPIPSTKYGGEDCETLYSVCTAGLAEDGVGCEWDQNESYQECFSRREDAWFFTERAEPAFTCQSDCKAQPTKKLRWLCAKTVRKLKKQGMC
ncbi:uncharacterized protein [Diadema setosum]|uniref:uncharacterized protein n=1 Tax=Diadema setosum TaxID=31175 RepID=UPI003B3ACEA0